MTCEDDKHILDSFMSLNYPHQSEVTSLICSRSALPNFSFDVDEAEGFGDFCP